MKLTINLLLLFISILLSAAFVLAVMEVRCFINLKQSLRCDWKNPNTKFDSELGWSPILNRKVKCPYGWEGGGT